MDNNNNKSKPIIDDSKEYSGAVVIPPKCSIYVPEGLDCFSTINNNLKKYVKKLDAEPDESKNVVEGLEDLGVSKIETSELYVPLKFWFSGQDFNREKYLDEYPDYHQNLYCVHCDVFERNLDDLMDLKKYFVDLQNDYLRASGNMSLLDMGCYRKQNIIFDDEIKILTEKINCSGDDSYKKPIQFLPDEIINGYEIKKFVGVKFEYDLFIKMKKKWNDATDLSYDEFSEMFYDKCCTEWYKMDRYGHCYGGFWNYPKDSAEYNDAWNLSGEDNCKALFELPYPKKFILYTIKIGCGSRLESVPFSNYMCEWMKRKME